MSFRDSWTRKFVESLTGDEKEAFKLWLDFSERRIPESEFKAKMDVKAMSRMLGKMSAARISALEDEVENLTKRVDTLEKKMRKAYP